MARVALRTAVHHVRNLVGPRHEAEPTDRQLLERFAAFRDEDAFAGLVRRHAALVRGVCRRVLGDAADADDVFQAVFVVLAKKAALLGRHASVAPWLQAVAYRLACRARVDAARRSVVERHRGVVAAACREQVGPEQAVLWRELQAVLDAELEALSERHRAPLVLCHLQGLTRDEAAERLGWSLGTLKRRLERGRELLRIRLTSRGLTVGAAAIATLMVPDAASARAATPLVAATIRTVLRSTPASRVAQLAQSAHALPSFGKSKIAAALFLTLGLAGGLGWALGGRQEREPRPIASQPQADVEGPKTDLHGDPLPSGALARLGTTRLRHGQVVNSIGFLSGGKALLTVAQDGAIRIWDVASGKELRRYSISGPAAAAPPGGFGGVVRVGLGVLHLGFAAESQAAVSADGTLLVSRGHDGAIRFRETATGKELRRIDPPETGVAALALSADGKQLAVRAFDGTIRLRDAATGKEVRTLGKKADPPAAGAGAVAVAAVPYVAGPSITFSPDGKTLAFAGPDPEDPKAGAVVNMWDTASGRKLRRIADPDAGALVAAPRFAPDGKALAWAKSDGTIRVIDAATGKELHALKCPGERPRGFLMTSFAFSPDSKTLVALSHVDNGVLVWDAATGKELRRFRLPANRFGLAAAGSGLLAVSPDGKLLAVGGGDHALHLLDAATGKPMGVTGGHRSAVVSVRHAPDGKTVTTTSEDGTIRVWDALTGEELHRVTLAEGPHVYALSADGRKLAVAQTDGAIHLRDVATNQELQTIDARNRGVAALAFAPDGKTLAVYGTTNKDVVIWLHDTGTGKEIRRIPIPMPAADRAGMMGLPFTTVTGMVFTRDGKTLASLIRPGTLGLWDVGTGRELQRIEAPDKRAILGAAFTRDGRSVALDLGEDVLSLVEVYTGKERRHYGKVRPKPDAAQAAGGGVAAAGVVVAAGIAGGPMPLWTRPAPSICFSPDAKLLAYGRAGGGVRFWDTASGKQVGQLAGHQGPIDTLEFAPDGKTLTTGSRDTTGLVWDVTRFARRGKSPTTPLDVEARWKDLADDDAARAYDALNAFGADPAAAAAYLRSHLSAATAPDADKIAKLVADLDGDQFAARKKADEELEKLGETAAPLLRKALAAGPSAEVKKRLEDLLAKASSMTPGGDALRSLRAVEVLETIATPAARQLLGKIAAGAPEARLTREARAALERLGPQPR
jgi:RNA polymerase sigma factor (sigma-70 family)